MNDKTPIEKLTVLLPHWLEHNEEHIADMRAYLQALSPTDATDTRLCFSQAITRMGEVSAALLATIATLPAATKHP